MPDAVHPANERVREAAAKRGVTIGIVTFDESTHTAQEAAAAIGVELGLRASLRSPETRGRVRIAGSRLSIAS